MDYNQEDRIRTLEKKVNTIELRIDELQNEFYDQPETNITCPHCHYQWLTKSKKDLTSCPKCTLKIDVKQNRHKTEKQDTKIVNNWIKKQTQKNKGKSNVNKILGKI